MRYNVVGFKEVREEGKAFPTLAVIGELAKTKEEANLFYDIMLEDESMCDHVQIIDLASKLVVRHSKEDDKIDPL